MSVEHLKMSEKNVLCERRLFFLMSKHHVTGIRQTDFQISYRSAKNLRITNLFSEISLPIVSVFTDLWALLWMMFLWLNFWEQFFSLQSVAWKCAYHGIYVASVISSGNAKISLQNAQHAVTEENYILISVVILLWLLLFSIFFFIFLKCSLGYKTTS